MRLVNVLLLVFISQVICEPEETTEAPEEQPSDQQPARPEPGSPPPGEGAEYDMTPFETLIKRCDGWEFPEASFDEQPDKDKVYLKPGKTGDGPFKDQNLTKFATAFGIRVIADDDVPDKKLKHVVNILAKIVDADQDGKPDNQKLIDELMTFHPILFLISSSERIMQLMNAQEAHEGFPMELKFCPFAFDFEEADKIVPGGPRGDATCPPEEGEENKNDRTVAFVLDHLMGRGFAQVLSDEQRQKLGEIYTGSLKAGTFEPVNTGCPAESDECGRVMLASWALSTLNGFDTCWCKNAHALKFCDAESLKEGETELAELLADLFPDAAKIDEKPYSPKDKSRVVQ